MTFLVTVWRRIGLHEDNVAKIRGAPRPTTKKQIRSFMGLAGYYRDFIANFAALAAPLSDLTVVTKTWNDLKPPKTTYNHLKPSTTTYNHLKKFNNHLKNTYNHSQTI